LLRFLSRKSLTHKFDPRHKWLGFWANCITGRMDRVVVGFVKDVAKGTVTNLQVIPASTIIPKCQVLTFNFVT